MTIFTFLGRELSHIGWDFEIEAEIENKEYLWVGYGIGLKFHSLWDFFFILQSTGNTLDLIFH